VLDDFNNEKTNLWPSKKMTFASPIFYNSWNIGNKAEIFPSAEIMVIIPATE
jgi:hypothetical protein